jgi:predicted HD phosphohydrolase
MSISDICLLFARKGGRAYDGEPVTQLEHALQTAARAQESGASPAIVTAALLHDLGHLLNDQGDTPTLRGIDDVHQYAALPFLRGLFDDDVLTPIKLHVDAKRYLCATRSDYYDALSGDSKRQPGAAGRRVQPGRSRRVHRAAACASCGGRASVGRPREDRGRANTAARALRDHHGSRAARFLMELSLGVTLAVLGAGLLHAGWNALIKSAGGGDALLDTATIIAGSTLCSLCALPFLRRRWPTPGRWRLRPSSFISVTT